MQIEITASESKFPVIRADKKYRKETDKGRTGSSGKMHH